MSDFLKYFLFIAIVFSACSKHNAFSVNNSMIGKWIVIGQNYYIVSNRGISGRGFDIHDFTDTIYLNIDNTGNFIFSYNSAYFSRLPQNIWISEKGYFLLSNDSTITILPNYGQFLNFLYEDLYKTYPFNKAIIKNISTDSLLIYENWTDSVSTFESDSIFFSRIQ